MFKLEIIVKVGHSPTWHFQLGHFNNSLGQTRLTVLCETKRNETKRNGTLRNGTLRNGTLRNGTLRNGYNTMLHHTLSRVPRIPLKAEDL